jgi:hypothetical protein
VEDLILWIVQSQGSVLRAEGSFPQIFLWKTKIPMKVRIFFWLMLKNSILTKDNVLMRG